MISMSSMRLAGPCRYTNCTFPSDLPLLNTEPLSSGAHQDPAMMAQWSK
jgi:hypothetical protein